MSNINKKPNYWNRYNRYAKCISIREKIPNQLKLGEVYHLVLKVSDGEYEYVWVYELTDYGEVYIGRLMIDHFDDSIDQVPYLSPKRISVGQTVYMAGDYVTKMLVTEDNIYEMRYKFGSMVFYTCEEANMKSKRILSYTKSFRNNSKY